MPVQTVFRRFELKYKLTFLQYIKLCEHLKDYMNLDEYGRHKISNIYFDTGDYRIIRHSLEKPKYKEKLRLRIYGEPQEDGVAFIELKKKFNGVVYKRRIPSTQTKALSYLSDEESPFETCQIYKEVDYFKQQYDGLTPRVYLSYEREAFVCENDENFRMTFDFNIKMRNKNISLFESTDDLYILQDDSVLLEVKTVSGLPFWFIDFLNQNHIYKTSFSKYGTAYTTFILPKFIENLRRPANVQ